MKMIGTIVKEKMSLIGCVASKDKKRKALSLEDVKSKIQNGEIDNFKKKEKGELVGVSKKLSNLFLIMIFSSFSNCSLVLS